MITEISGKSINKFKSLIKKNFKPGKSDGYERRIQYSAILSDSHLDPSQIEHFFEYYLNNWMIAKCDPFPEFSTKFYLDQNPDVVMLGIEPLWHYCMFGYKEQRDPHPLFSSKFYSKTYLASSAENPLLHFCRTGYALGNVPHPFFESHRNSGQTFLSDRFENLKKPHWFDGKYYLKNNPDLESWFFGSLEHYILSGFSEGRKPAPGIDIEWVKSRARAQCAGDFDEIDLMQKFSEYLSDPSRQSGFAEKLRYLRSSADQSDVFSIQRKKIDYDPIQNKSYDVLIPVYKRPDQVLKLLRSIERDRRTLPFIKTIHIGDDASDEGTRTFLRNYAEESDLPIQLHFHDSNLGFAENCNFLAKLVASDIFVLLNSDTVMPDDWLVRLVSPLELNSEIYLASPFSNNAANLSIKGNDGNSWIDIDSILKETEACYPDACTTIGFCLAVSHAVLKEAPLFDPAFKAGYGEDTDLHYRVLQMGKRGVIADNILVYHQGGASFNQLQNVKEIQQNNRRKFFELWQVEHDKEYQDYVQLNSKGWLRHDVTLKSKWTLVESKVDFLVVIPCSLFRNGGVRVIFDLFEDLIISGYRVAYFSETTHAENTWDRYGVQPIYSISNLKELIKDVGGVFITAATTESLAREIADHYEAKLYYLAQGPEHLFASGVKFFKFIKSYRDATIFTVSNFLSKHLSDYGFPSSTNLNLGPRLLTFYPAEVPRDPMGIAVNLNTICEKGSAFALHIMWQARKKGYNIYFFGPDVPRFDVPDGIGTMLGELDQPSMAKLFSRVSFYLDCSILEGLGLLPLEALFCGAVPVITKKGGPDCIFKHLESAVFISDVFFVDQLFEDMKAMTKSESFEASRKMIMKSNNFESCSEMLLRELSANHRQIGNDILDDTLTLRMG